MADTGAPWNIPFAEPSDLVRDWPDLSEDVANAVAAGLDAAGGLVAVKHVLKTDTFVSGSLALGADEPVTGLSITHEVADPDNKLIISAFFGVASSADSVGGCAIAIHDGTGLIGIGNADGNRSRVAAGAWSDGAATSNQVGSTPSITFVHTPGAGSKTYTVRAINVGTGTQIIYVNRNQLDNNSGSSTRGVSALVIQEIKV